MVCRDQDFFIVLQRFFFCRDLFTCTFFISISSLTFSNMVWITNPDVGERRNRKKKDRYMVKRSLRKLVFIFNFLRTFTHFSMSFHLFPSFLSPFPFFPLQIRHYSGICEDTERRAVTLKR